MVPMTPKSPKAADIRRKGSFALHCAVEDSQGGGGEVLVTGVGSEVAAPGDFTERGWIAFNLRIAEVLCVRHPPHHAGPVTARWKPLDR